MAFLKKTPAENGVPPHMMTVDFRAAKGAPVTVETLREEAWASKGFDHAGGGVCGDEEGEGGVQGGGVGDE